MLAAHTDAVVASTPGAPEDPPAGAGLGRARLRIGEDVANDTYRLRVVLEARTRGTSRGPYSDMEGGRLTGALRLADAFVGFRRDETLHAHVGLLRVPFSLSRQIDDGALRFPERAAIIQGVVPDFRVGTMIGGDLGAMTYGVAVLANNPDLDRRVFDRGLLFAMRIVGEPIGPMGVTPWRRTRGDPWYDWFRFSLGVSMLGGLGTGPYNGSVGVDLQAQWRRWLVTGEYVFASGPGFDQHGAVVEPGLSLFDGWLHLAARADWRHTAGVDEWGGGGAITNLAFDPRMRVQIGFERRKAAGLVSEWAIARLAFALD